MDALSKIAGFILWLLMVVLYYAAIFLGVVLGCYVGLGLVDLIAGTSYRENFLLRWHTWQDKRATKRAKRQAQTEAQGARDANWEEA
ncbi:MAG: hypothetical protein KDH96_09355 [Candidatus Riesia sp.]|nr:hypothetical protein [Candidatus Riesia sp.]